MDRNLALDFVRVTEDAAVSAAKWVGKGDKHMADDAAVKLMRSRFNNLDIDGTVVIGEGERDEAPMLFIGEKVGTGKGMKTDIAVDPLECTNSVAFGRNNAMSVVAASPKGTMLHAPDTYMQKIAAPKEAKGKISVDEDVNYNLQNLAHALGKKVNEITVMVLDRERHEKLIKEIRDCDARIILIPDGDISGAMAPSIPGSGVDILMGIGAAPEGVLAASALASLGGYMEVRFAFRSPEEKKRAEGMGVKKLESVMRIRDMVDTDSAIFAATGVTDGPFLKGVRFTKEGYITNSIITRSKSKTVRFIESYHTIEEKR